MGLRCRLIVSDLLSEVVVLHGLPMAAATAAGLGVAPPTTIAKVAVTLSEINRLQHISRRSTFGSIGESNLAGRFIHTIFENRG